VNLSIPCGHTKCIGKDGSCVISIVIGGIGWDANAKGERDVRIFG